MLMIMKNGLMRENALHFRHPHYQRYDYSLMKKAIDAQQFIDFYEAKGWMIGKNKMKDWRAAVRTWTHRPIQNSNNATNETGQRIKDL